MSRRGSDITRAARPRPTPPKKHSSMSVRDALASRLGNDLVRRLLEELRDDPKRAHRTWKNLSGAERQVIANSCGEPFANAFDQALPKDRQPMHFAGPGVSTSTPEQMRARGFCLLGHRLTGDPARDVEGWLHPSGYMLERAVSGPSTLMGRATDKDEDPGEDDDGVTIEYRPPNQQILKLPDDPNKVLRVVTIGNENLAVYCADSPYDLFEGEDGSEEHVNEYVEKVKLIRWKIEDALRALEGLRNGERQIPPGFTLPGDFWKKVDAAKATYEARKQQCDLVMP